MGAQLTNLKLLPALLQQCRTHASSPTSEYDLIASEVGMVRFDSYTKEGFVINSVQMDGAVLACGTLFTLWNVQSLQDITPESLSLLLLLRPPPDLLIVGTGRELRQLPQAVRDFCKQNMVSLEVLSTQHAVSTFNILNMEARTVAAAMLPSSK